MKFQDESFDKRIERVRTTKLARNINLDDEDELETMQKVINHLTRGKQWKKAIWDEYEFLIKNHTWDLVRRLKERRIITNKWALKHKKNEIARIVRLKIRLVARGFNQIYDIDYLDIYASVVKLASIRILLAIAAIYGLKIHQMNVMTALLISDLKEEYIRNCRKYYWNYWRMIWPRKYQIEMKRCYVNWRKNCTDSSK